MNFSSPHLTIISRSESHDDGYDRNVDRHGGRNGRHLAACHCFPGARDSGVHQVSPLLSPASGAIPNEQQDQRFPFQKRSTEDAKMSLYSAWLFPWVLYLVMQQEQLKPFRERIAVKPRAGAFLRSASDPD